MVACTLSCCAGVGRPALLSAINNESNCFALLERIAGLRRFWRADRHAIHPRQFSLLRFSAG